MSAAQKEGCQVLEPDTGGALPIGESVTVAPVNVRRSWGRRDPLGNRRRPQSAAGRLDGAYTPVRDTT